LILKTTPGFERALRRSSESQARAIETALSKLLAAFCRPHDQLGLRKLRKNIFEFRVGLDLRIVFRKDDVALFLREIGNHDKIRRFLERF